MVRLFSVLIAVFALISISGCGSEDDHAPSSGAKDMPGALGTFEFKPKDWKKGELTYWTDTDGVDPGVAGCHLGTDKDGKTNGRMFGEACLSETELVESNPGKDVVHSHTDDTGHPDKFDCNAWCVGKGSAKGICQAAPAPPCEASAKCVCE